MFRKLALVLILLIPAIAAQAFSVDVISITNLSSVNGNCVAGDLITLSVTASFQGTVDDGGDFDWFTSVLYDGNGTVLNTFNGNFSVGFSTAPGSLSYPLQTAALSRPFTLKFFDTTSSTTAALAATYPLIESLSFDPADYGVCESLPDATAIVVSEDGSAPHFVDGRINNFDMASPIVVYGQDFEDGRGLVVYSPEGELLLLVPPREFAVECTGQTSLLARVNGVSLYRLDTCEYQIMARSLDGTKNYVLIFNSPYPDSGYTSYEE